MNNEIKDMEHNNLVVTERRNGNMNDGIRDMEPTSISQELTNLTEEVEEIETKQDALEVMCNKNDSNNAIIADTCEKLISRCKTLEDENKELTTQIGKLEDNLKDSGKVLYEKLHEEITAKADKEENESVKQEIKRHDYNICILLCAVMVANIFATFDVFWAVDTHVGQSLDSMIIMNTAALLIWAYWLDNSEMDSWIELWAPCSEFVLYIFNAVVWNIYTYHPIEKMTTQTIVLAAFLMIANIPPIIMKVLYFYNGKKKKVDIHKANIVIGIVETVLLIAILIMSILWIRF